MPIVCGHNGNIFTHILENFFANYNMFVKETQNV